MKNILARYGFLIALGLILACALSGASAFLEQESADRGFAALEAGPRDAGKAGGHAVMRPTKEKLDKWDNEYRNAPRAEEKFKKKDLVQKSASVLDLLDYDVDERNQGYCGDCWVWAGTGVLEVALNAQEGVKDRLSIQYLQSNYNGGGGSGYACCGGNINEFTSFYQFMGKTVPWSNLNANFQDYYKQCGQSANVSAGLIGEDPSYGLADVQAYTISTYNNPSAVQNIKNVIDNDRAVYFAFYAPTKDDGDAFIDFWRYGSESTVWNPDYACGHRWDPSYGWGHAVLLTGYDDSDPANSYWIVLNSWGSSAERPNGLFRMNMSMNYDCLFTYPPYAYITYNFQTMDVAYSNATTSTSTTTAPTTTTVPDSCTDTDGTDFFTKGYVSGYSSGIPYSYTDWCNGTFLTEHTCYLSQYYPITWDCAWNSSTCIDGACVPLTTSTTVEPTTTSMETTTSTTTSTSTSTSTSTTSTSTTLPGTLCWSGSNTYLYRSNAQIKKFCKCAMGTYGSRGYAYLKDTSTVYEYTDAADNDIWTVESLTSSKPVNLVYCMDKVWYQTNKDYYA